MRKETALMAGGIVAMLAGGSLMGYAVGTAGQATAPAPMAPVTVTTEQAPTDDAPATEPWLQADNFEGAVALCYYYFIPETEAWSDCVLAADAAWPVEESESIDS